MNDEALQNAMQFSTVMFVVLVKVEAASVRAAGLSLIIRMYD